MATIRLDKKIVDFVRRVKKLKKFGNGTISGVISSALKFFRWKHSECYTCQFHRDHIANLELGRQKIAIEKLPAGPLDILHSGVLNEEEGLAKRRKAAPSDGDWVVIRDDEHELLAKLAITYRRTAKQVLEQAVIEHVTRPPQCAACPFFHEMCARVKKREYKPTVIPDADGIDIRPKQDPAQEAS